LSTQDLVVIRTFDTVLQAYMLKNLLESYDVYCILADEHFITNYPLMSIGVGGIKLKVLDDDVQKSLAIIEQFESSKPNTY
jgi:hypothetical protein